MLISVMPDARRRRLNALVAASLKPPEMLHLSPGQLVRGVRARRRLSQRELALKAGIPLSTISRIESGEVSPRFNTLQALLSAGNVVLVAMDSDRPYAPLAENPLGDRLRDRAGRRVPAHLPSWLIRSMWDPWWGWSRTGWTLADKTVPTHSYEGRPKTGRPLPWERWRDVT